MSIHNLRDIIIIRIIVIRRIVASEWSNDSSMWPIRPENAVRILPEPSKGPRRAPRAHLVGQGGGTPLRAPSRAPRDPFLSPRFGTGIGTASAACFGSTQLRHRTGRGAPEHVNMGVNSMSTVSLLGRSRVTHGPFLDSQLAPPRALFRHPKGLNPQCLNGRTSLGEKGPGYWPPGLQVPIKALVPGASFNIYSTLCSQPNCCHTHIQIYDSIIM